MALDVQQLLAEYPLQTLLQTIPTGLFLVNKEMQIVYWNAEAARVTGFSTEEVIGQHCSFLEGQPCLDTCGLFDDSVEKPINGISCTLRHKDGNRIELSKNIDLLRNKQGEVIGGIEAFIDITPFKDLESDLRQGVKKRTKELEMEKAGLRSVLDGMTDPVYICDKDFNITFTNRAMQEIFGDIIGQCCYQALHSRADVCSVCSLPDVLAGKVTSRERFLKKTGQTYEIIHSPYPVADNPTHKIGVFRDITERKEVERRLQQANRELDAFVSTVSHDLRSPLTPIIGFAEILEERNQDQMDALGKECLGEIKKTAIKMKSLLEDLLELARVGQLKSPNTPANLEKVAEDVLVELADKIIEKQAKIEISSLPYLRVPESLLSDMLRNLLVNALKYAAAYDPHIEIKGEQLKGRVRCRVVDHGPGIEKNEKEEIFEPFKRGSTGKSVVGTGIGLATVAKIARIYHGDAWVEDTPGGGATFVVEFPDNCPESE